jgi:hypothetical protein
MLSGTSLVSSCSTETSISSSSYPLITTASFFGGLIVSALMTVLLSASIESAEIVRTVSASRTDTGNFCSNLCVLFHTSNPDNFSDQRNCAGKAVAKIRPCGQACTLIEGFLAQGSSLKCHVAEDDYQMEVLDVPANDECGWLEARSF